VCKKLVLALVLVAITVVGSLAEETAPNVLKIGTGFPDGIYYNFATELARLCAEKGLDIEVVSTAGSVANIQCLGNSDCDVPLDLAMVQNDVINAARNGNIDLGDISEKVQVIYPLYNEVAHILVRSGLIINNITQLRGKRISMGPIGSGSEYMAKTILESAGITYQEIDYLNDPINVALRKLRKGKIDAVFYIAGLPGSDPSVSNVIRDYFKTHHQAYFLPIDPKVLVQLKKNYKYMVVTGIPKGTYFINNNIETIGIPALLLARDGISEGQVKTILDVLFKNHNEFFKMTTSFRQLSAYSQWEFSYIRLGKVVESYLNSNYRLRIFLSRGFNYFLIGIIAFLVTFLMVFKRRALVRFARDHEYLRIVILMLVILLAGGIGLYLFEHKENENFITVWSSVWSIMLYMISGFESRYPISIGGRVFSIITMALGMGVVGLFTATLASSLVNLKMERRGKMPDFDEGHYVICNWNDGGYNIIKELHSAIFDHKAPILVLADPEINIPFLEEKIKSNNGAQPENGEKDIFDSVYLCPGDPTDDTYLRRAKVHKAKSVIVLGDRRLGEMADAKSILTVLAVRKLCQDLNGQGKQVHITLELENPKNIELAKHASTAGNGDLEIVSAEDLQLKLIAQSAVTKGLVNIYLDLLTFSEDTNEFYRVEIPPTIIGQNLPFHGVVDIVCGNLKKHQISLIPIGLYRKGKAIVNPRSVDVGNIEQGDELLVIAYSPPKESLLWS